jgi:uncharacterized protein YecT (DUF1311 family)
VTTVDIEACEGRQLLSLGRQFNVKVAALWPILDASSRSAFLRANTAWLTYRDQACTARARLFAGGSAFPVVYGQCEIDLTAARLKEVSSTLRYYCQGAARVGRYRGCAGS